MNTGVNALKRMNGWETVDIVNRQNVMHTKFVCFRELDENGNMKRHTEHNYSFLIIKTVITMIITSSQ